MQKFLLVLTIFIILLLSAESSYSQWVKTGFPDSLGSPSALAVADGILIAGTWGYGISRSTDGGTTWESANDGLPSFAAQWVEDIISAPATGGGTYLYAGFEYGGIYRSTDDGLSWTEANTGFLPQTDLSRFTSVGTTVLVGLAEDGTSGVWRTNNDGGNWTISNGGFATLADSNVFAFAVSPPGGSGSNVFAATGGGVFLSTTDGASWTAVNNGLPAGVADPIGISSGFGGINLFTCITYKGVYRSTDNGSSWTEADNGINTQSIVVTDFATSPTFGDAAGPNIFIADEVSIIVSTDNGQNWWDTGWPYYSAGPTGRLFITGGNLLATGFGIWKYSTAPDTGWTVQVSGTADTLQTVKAVDNNVVWAAGTSGGVFRTTNGGSTWDSVGRGAIGRGTIFSIDALDANTAFVASDSGTAGAILKTTNGGTTWTKVFSQTGGILTGIRMKSSTEGYAVGIPVGGKWTVLKTTDGGNTWPPIPNEPAQVGGDEGTLGVDLTGNMLSFGTFSGKIYRSTDLGTTWTSDSIYHLPVNALHFNSSSTGIAGLDDGKTDRSTNGGVSWDPAGTAGTSAVNCISGLNNEYWAIIGSDIAYSKDTGKTLTYATPGFHGLLSLDAVSFTPAASAVNGWAVGDNGIILHYQRLATAVLQDAHPLPTSFKLEQNYPNPFNPSTTIHYELPKASFVTLTVYNTLGQRVTQLINGQQQAGYHDAVFHADQLAGGVYFYRLTAGNYVDTKKLVLLK